MIVGKGLDVTIKETHKEGLRGDGPVHSLVEVAGV